MHVSYIAFLEEHLNYLIARLMAAKDEEQKELIYSIKRVRGILNDEEFKKLSKND